MKKQILIISLLAVTISLQAKVWRVNNTKLVDADFTSAQAAHDSIAVVAGDTIYFEGSPDSYGDLTMIKNLVLIGPGYFLGENKGNQVNLQTAKIGSINLVVEPGRAASPGVSAVPASSSAGSVITGLQIDKIIIYTTSIIIKRNLIRDITLNEGSNGNWNSPITSTNFVANSNNTVIIQNYIAGFVSIGGSDNVLVSNNIINFTSYWDNAILSNTTYSINLTVLNNYIGSTSPHTVGINNSIFRNNIIKGSTSILNSTLSNNISTTTLPVGDNNQNGADLTQVIAGVGSTDSFFQLLPTSLGKGAAYDGGDCGAFGGSSPYVLSGIPSIPSIYDFNMPASGTTTNGIKVTIKAKTNQ